MLNKKADSTFLTEFLNHADDNIVICVCSTILIILIQPIKNVSYSFWQYRRSPQFLALNCGNFGFDHELKIRNSFFYQAQLKTSYCNNSLKEKFKLFSFNSGEHVWLRFKLSICYFRRYSTPRTETSGDLNTHLYTNHFV